MSVERCASAPADEAAATSVGGFVRLPGFDLAPEDVMADADALGPFVARMRCSLFPEWGRWLEEEHDALIAQAISEGHTERSIAKAAGLSGPAIHQRKTAVAKSQTERGES